MRFRLDGGGSSEDVARVSDGLDGRSLGLGGLGGDGERSRAAGHFGSCLDGDVGSQRKKRRKRWEIRDGVSGFEMGHR